MIPCRMNPMGSGWPREGSYGVFLTSSGTAVSSAIVMSGAIVSGTDYAQNVYSHGTARETVISSGGIMRVSSGGTASYTQVQGGTMYLIDDGTAKGTVLSEGYVAIRNAHVSSLTLSNSSSFLTVSSGGTSFRTTITDGWNGVYAGGVTISTMLSSGGRQNVSSGGITTSTRIPVSGRQIVSAGASAYYTVISSGGTMIVQSGGSAIDVSSRSGAVVVSSAGAYITYA